MALATYRCLCIDANEPDRVGPWWAEVLGLRWSPAEPAAAPAGSITGPTPGQTILVMAADEPKSVKQRVHLDIYTRALGDLEASGSVVVEPQREGWGWTVMADPEGGEYCAFMRDPLPAERLHGVVIDSADPTAIAGWWANVLGGDLIHHTDGYSTVEHVPGMPDLTMDFVPVPEPKTVKNRIHWDLRTADIGALTSTGARVLRGPDDEIRWTVMADPEGNEFCVFPPAG
jgi:hypothetical protein